MEQKNLLRQNFVAPDVDKPKAVVLANRYSKAFGVSITPIVKMVETATGNEQYSDDEDTVLLHNAMNTCVSNGIVILCVDSPEARRSILSYLVHYKNYINGGSNNKVLLIDAGNENDYGQVTLSTLSHPDFPEAYANGLPSSLPGDLSIPLIPIDLSYFEGMVAVSAGSCADLDQTMAINTAMATTIFGIIQNFYYAKPMAYHRVDVSLSFGSIPQYMNMNWLREINKQDGFVGGRRITLHSLVDQLLKFREDVYKPFMALMAKAEKEAKEKTEKKTEVAEVPASEVLPDIKEAIAAGRRGKVKTPPMAPPIPQYIPMPSRAEDAVEW